MDDASEKSGSVPSWDRRFPGRFQREMDDFAEAKVTPSIDKHALADGRLEVSFEWPLDEKLIPLRVVYPDGYPFLRPHIFVTDPAFLPKRHYSPVDGALCLIGRDTRQWASSWSVPELLRRRLRDVYSDGASEDPQGEPAEVWWNIFSRPGSYCLIDSSWSLLSVEHPGRLKVLYRAELETTGEPIFSAIVVSVLDAAGYEVATWTGALPPLFRGTDVHSMEIPWKLSSEQILPKLKSADPSLGLPSVLGAGRDPSSMFRFDSQTSMSGCLHAILYPTETQFQQEGDAWLFVLEVGKRSAFYPGKKDAQFVNISVIRTLRAGPGDLISRAPALSQLSKRAVAVIGTGAIGAPLAVELARNGVGRLALMDFDVLEPGNSVRWPLGATAWGHLKASALADFIRAEYPRTEVSVVTHCLGTFSDETQMRDSLALAQVLTDVDLVVDGTASFGTTSLIRDETQIRSLPLIVLYASPSVAGGVVALYAPAGGCPVCLEYAWHDEPRSIDPPPGMFEENELIQPPGCAERTFSGAFFDLQELSLQAVRVAVGHLVGKAHLSSSNVYTLTFQEDGGIRLPSWRKNTLPPHPGCSCQK